MNDENPVSLRKHIGVLPSGKQVEHNQWQVYIGETLGGYLPHDPNVPIMLIYNPPPGESEEIVRQCEAIVKRKVLPPKPIYIPEGYNILEGRMEEPDDDEEDEEE